MYCQKKHKHNFDNYIKKMEQLGYSNFYEVLNAKNYGVPQNRERVFVISCLEDIDYKFPDPMGSYKALKEILEEEVDEKYYISTEKTIKLIMQITGYDQKIEENKINFQNCEIFSNCEHAKECEKSNNCVITEIKNEKIKNKRNKGLGVLINQATKEGSIYCKNDGIVNIGQPNSQTRRGRVIDNGDCCGTLTTQEEMGIVQIGNIVNTGNFENPQRGRIYSKEGLSPSLNTVGGGGLEPKIIEVTKYNENRHSSAMNSILDTKGISPALDTMQGGNRQPKIIEVQKMGNVNPSCKGQNGDVVNVDGLARTVTVEKGEGQKVLSVRPILTPERLEKRQNGRRAKEDNEPMFTITAQDRHGVIIVTEENQQYFVNIRKLTPLECWRLMGFRDKEFIKAEQVNSNSQLYKQAGNSIVVDVLVAIFKVLFDN